MSTDSKLIHLLGCALAWLSLLFALTGAAAQSPIGYEEVATIVEVVVVAKRSAGAPEISRGWAIQGNHVCYVIAPKHGVYSDTEGPFDDIVIRGVRQDGITQIDRSATLTRAFDADLALLRLSEPECPFALPSGFKPSDDHRAWILRPYEHGYGRQVREVRPLFEIFSPDEHVARVPTDESAVPIGWSGSTVFLGNIRVGMVRAVNDDGQSVIFYTQKKIQDEIEDYLKVFGSTARPVDGETFKDCSDCPEMVVVPAGRFTMGSRDPERDWDEEPIHGVNVRSFAIGMYEVTFAEWDACTADGGCRGYRPNDAGWGRGRQPVINVSWHDAQAYTQWLSGKTRKWYRLLTEAEWEYAARAGTQTLYSFGHTITPDQANYEDRNLHKSAPVGSYPANAFGIYDMYGNVWEWVEDCWHDNYSGAPSDGSAWTSGGDCDKRVLRGGSWRSASRNLRSTARIGSVTEFPLNIFGFRVARTLDP